MFAIENLQAPLETLLIGICLPVEDPSNTKMK